MVENKMIRYSYQVEFIAALTQQIERLNPDCKTVIFIEPYGSVLPLLHRGVRSGFNIIILTANTDMRKVSLEILEAVTLSIQVDTVNDVDLMRLTQIIKKMTTIHAVIPGFEYFVPVAIKMANHLGLQTIRPDNIQQFRNKLLMREKLATAGVLIPRYKMIHSFDDLYSACELIGFPAVCKPVDAAGSVHVKKVTNQLEAFEAAECILYGNDILWGHQLAKQALYEEYIDGKEYSMEGTIANGKVNLFSITEKHLSDESEFIEIGHVANMPISPDLNDKLTDYLMDVIRVLQPINCPFHAEIRINQQGHPVLMEIAARLAGDRIGDLINYTTQTNYYDDIYSAYFGTVLSPVEHSGTIAGIRFFYRPCIDAFTHISGLEVTKQYHVDDFKIYYQQGEIIPSFPKPLRRLGHVIVSGNNYSDLMSALNAIDKSIIFHPMNRN